MLTCVVSLECWDLALSVLQLRLQADVDVVDQVGEQRQREGYGRAVLLRPCKHNIKACVRPTQRVLATDFQKSRPTCRDFIEG